MLIYQYDDYRVFLKEALIRLKGRSPSYSYTKVARKVGCSESFLKKLFALKTHLGLRHATRLMDVLQLSEAERQYLHFWLLYELTEAPEVRHHLKYILSVLKHRAESGIAPFQKETEEQSIQMEIESCQLLTHAALEMSRVYGRPAQVADLRRDLSPVLQRKGDLEEACARASHLLRAAHPGDANPVHHTKSGPVSEVARDAMASLRSVTSLSSELVDRLHEHGPFTVYAGLSAIAPEDGVRVLEILRSARSQVIDINQNQEKPTRLMAVQIQGFFLTVRPEKPARTE